MALDEGDVLNTLSDSATMKMDFWVGSVHVSGRSYGIIRDHVKAENIIVSPGTDSLAFYDDKTDVLTTQTGTPPANLDQRALLLHECTHALVDIFYPDNTITRHNDELAAYFAQHTYMLLSNPSWTVAPNNRPWFTFFSDVTAMVKRYHLNEHGGRGTPISLDELEPLRTQLAALPGVNYHDFKKEDLTGSNGLLRSNPFLQTHEEVSTRSSTTATETYPDPSDDYLIRTLNERYAASDVKGYGKRLRELRKDFAKCSVSRVRVLIPRLSARKPGDKVSELFFDRLSTAGRAILLRVLKNRVA